MGPKETLLVGLVGVGVAGAWWLLRRAKREDYQRERRDAAERAARAEQTETTADDEAEADIIEDLERDARADDKDSQA